MNSDCNTRPLCLSPRSSPHLDFGGVHELLRLGQVRQPGVEDLPCSAGAQNYLGCTPSKQQQVCFIHWPSIRDSNYEEAWCLSAQDSSGVLPILNQGRNHAQESGRKNAKSLRALRNISHKSTDLGSKEHLHLVLPLAVLGDAALGVGDLGAPSKSL